MKKRNLPAAWRGICDPLQRLTLVKSNHNDGMLCSSISSVYLSNLRTTRPAGTRDTLFPALRSLLLPCRFLDSDANEASCNPEPISPSSPFHEKTSSPARLLGGPLALGTSYRVDEIIFHDSHLLSACKSVQ